MDAHYFAIREKDRWPVFEVSYFPEQDKGKIVKYNMNGRLERDCVFIDRDEYYLLSEFYNEAVCTKEDAVDERTSKLVGIVDQIFDHLKSLDEVLK